MIGPQWLESIKEVSGLDPLGVQAISISIYGYLLPGMTNVTNRLRYYTFLCWVLSNYAKKSGSAKIEDWHYYLRKSEFLFALIAEMHHCEENYSSSMVGSRTTSPLIKKEKKEVIDIAKYTKLEGPHKSYFQNPGGGFAQYYQGPMKSLKFIVDGGEIRWQLADDIAEPKEKQLGVKAAKIFDSNAHLDLFHRCVIAEQVSREQLKKMADSLCACRIETNKDEQALLLNILFDLNDQYAESGLRRRKSLRLLLNLIINDENTGLSVEEFRNICMYHYYSNGKRLKIREDETEVINFWDVYQTHEYFAFALQCLLYVFERMVKKTNGSFNEVFEEMRKEALQVDPDKVQSMAAFKRVDIGMNALLSKFITSISFSNSYDCVINLFYTSEAICIWFS